MPTLLALGWMPWVLGVPLRWPSRSGIDSTAGCHSRRPLRHMCTTRPPTTSGDRSARRQEVPEPGPAQTTPATQPAVARDELEKMQMLFFKIAEGG